MRHPSENETAILQKLLSVNIPGVAELLVQIQNIMVQAIDYDDNYSSIELLPQNFNKCAISQRVPVEGSWKDKNGGNVSILLHVIDGFLHELDIIKDDGTALIGLIELSQIEVTTNI